MFGALNAPYLTVTFEDMGAFAQSEYLSNVENWVAALCGRCTVLVEVAVVDAMASC